MKTMPPLFEKIYQTPLGQMVGLFVGQELVMLAFDDASCFHTLRKRIEKETFEKETCCSTQNELTDLLEHQLDAYFKGELQRFTIPIRMIGTEFQKNIWKVMNEIPHGTTISYRELCRKVGRIGSERAVANALSKNPIWILLPCHRVIASNGTLAGYAGGIQRKQKLICLEQQNQAV